MCSHSVRRAPALGLALAGLALATVAAAAASARTKPVVRPNPNTERAGVLKNGVLMVTLEARQVLWRLNGSTRPPMTIDAFAEPGKSPLIPGPLVRAARGTTLRFAIRNFLAEPLTLLVPRSLHGDPDPSDAMDSVLVQPGAVATYTTHARAAGNYIYRATTPGGAGKFAGITGLLAGGIVIDSAGAPIQAHDRVFVIMQTPDSAFAACADTITGNRARLCGTTREVFTINGRSWPNTERIRATVGDSLHWRIINASHDVHPMHLHGFYYRIDAFSVPPGNGQRAPEPGQMAVTQAMTRFSTMSMTWSPDRPGDWLFHCHFAIHLLPDSLSSENDDPYLRGMAGLAIGTIVTGRTGVGAAGDPAAVRRLRLVAESDGRASRERPYHLEAPDSVRSMHFVLAANGHSDSTHTDFSPELDLVRGEPVAITIVNHLDEPTSVHWHGIEVEDSYMDGVPGFSGSGTHLTPAIAPGDSFVARFTPPRAGTFMYHAHVDDAREQLGGLEGALIVRAPGETPSTDEHVLFLKGYAGTAAHPLEIDGQSNPDTIVLHTGRPARFRIINLSTVNPTPQFWLTARRDSAAQIATDSMLVYWRPLAKDGFDQREAERAPRPAHQLVAVGETYDFEYTARQTGTLRVEVRRNGGPHQLLIRVPIRVE